MNCLKCFVVFAALTFNLPIFANPPKVNDAMTSSVSDEELTPGAASAWLQPILKQVTNESEEVIEPRRRGRAKREWVESEVYGFIPASGFDLYSVETDHPNQSLAHWGGTRFIADGNLRTHVSRLASEAVSKLSSALIEKHGNEKAFLALAFLVLRAGNLNSLTSEADLQLIQLAIEVKLAQIAAEISQKYGVENLIRLSSTFPELEWSSLKTYQIRMKANGCAAQVQNFQKAAFMP